MASHVPLVLYYVSRSWFVDSPLPNFLELLWYDLSDRKHYDCRFPTSDLRSTTVLLSEKAKTIM